MGRLDNKVALVTGAARGQGRSHAVRLAEEGADIIAVDICEQIDTAYFAMPGDEELVETVGLVENLDRRIIARKADVRDEAGLAAAVAEGVDALGRLDIVVANAGIGTFGPALDTTEKEWDEVVDVDLKGVWHTAKIGARHIIAGGQGGSIVMTSSIIGVHGAAFTVPYVAAKHGVVGLMRALAIEFGPHRIRVNSVHPTQVNTPMLMNSTTFELFCPDVKNPTQEDFAPRSQAMHTLPVPWVEPVDISNAIVFLVSDEARYITGVPLPVDCGCDLIN
jgi:SDR family mycofactocin-dependent oxidoreductase